MSYSIASMFYATKLFMAVVRGPVLLTAHRFETKRKLGSLIPVFVQLMTIIRGTFGTNHLPGDQPIWWTDE